MSSNEDGKPSRTSLSFMLNPTADEPVASSSRAPPRLPELKPSPYTPQPLLPTPLITPPTPIAPNGMEQMQSRMDVDTTPTSPRLAPRSASPLSPSSSTSGVGAGGGLTRRLSRKRSASPSEYDERWGSSSPSRESVSSGGVRDEGRVRYSAESRRPVDAYSARPSIDSHTHSTRPSMDAHRRTSMESHSHSAHPSIDSTRLSIDSRVHSPRHSIDSTYHPQPTDEERARSKSSLSHLLDGDGFGGMSPTGPGPVRAPRSAGSAGRPTSSTSTAARPISKRGSISTAMAGMQLKSAATSRASSPGGRERAHAWPTFSAAGESMSMSGPDVWRHETEADMKRRELEAEGRRREREAARRDVDMEVMVPVPGEVDLHRRRSEGAKRRRIITDDGGAVSPRSDGTDEVELERRRSVVEPDARMTIVEQLRRATGEMRRGSIPMPGGWIAETESLEPASVIVVSDSPEMPSNDMVLEADAPQAPLVSAPIVPDEVPSKSPTPHPAPESRNGSTTPAPASAPFEHIWPPPAIPIPDMLASKKARKLKPEADSAPSRSFITPLNISTTPAPSVPPEEDIKEKDVGPSKDKDMCMKDTTSSGISALRSMLTTMPSRAVFMTSVQDFLSQPATKTRRPRAVVMTKTLMKDALSVLLDPTTDALLKDYVPPEKKKDEDRDKDKDKERDGTPARGRKQSSSSSSTDLEFRAWARRMFSTVKTSRGEDTLAFGGKPVVVEDDIYETIVVCHSQGNHCSTDETAKLVDQKHVSPSPSSTLFLGGGVLISGFCCRAGCRARWWRRLCRNVRDVRRRTRCRVWVPRQRNASLCARMTRRPLRLGARRLRPDVGKRRRTGSR
jgi:hypothetical protein